MRRQVYKTSKGASKPFLLLKFALIHVNIQPQTSPNLNFEGTSRKRMKRVCINDRDIFLAD
jgi:hypothetical protein